MIASLVIINQLVYISVCVCRACNANKLDIIARSGDMWHFANLSPSNLALCISGLLSLSLARLWLREIFVSAEELWSQTSPNGTSAISEPLEFSHPDFHFLLPSLPSGVGRIGWLDHLGLLPCPRALECFCQSLRFSSGFWSASDSDV